MTVIPFDPERRRNAPDMPAVPDTPSAEALDAPRGFPLTAPDLPAIEGRILGEAVRRIEQLERSLIAALRENAQNWARAEEAERRLRAMAGKQTQRDRS